VVVQTKVVVISYIKLSSLLLKLLSFLMELWTFLIELWSFLLNMSSSLLCWSCRFAEDVVFSTKVVVVSTKLLSSLLEL